ncbi:MAG: hypothetical protein JNL80_17475 [Phycisphaerae bacterium]|nr:hypothetical protein [Phycisphaerae bacterium]
MSPVPEQQGEVGCVDSAIDVDLAEHAEFGVVPSTPYQFLWLAAVPSKGDRIARPVRESPEHQAGRLRTNRARNAERKALIYFTIS